MTGPPGAPGPSGADRTPSPAQVAVSMFTIIPVPAAGPVDAALASRAVRWLPAVGLLLSVPAAAALLLAGLGGSAGDGAVLRRLLGAVLAVVVLGVLTGGLHLDGLSDTADGLASRRPRDDALAIMRRGDTGPLGVAALVFVVLLQVTALAVLPGRLAVTGLVLAAVTARTAVVVATGPGFPPARPGGFGALVAGRTPKRVTAAAVIILLAVAAGAGELGGGPALAAQLPAASAAGVLAAVGVARMARSRLGGLTGDIFGAVVEIATAATLVTLALLS
jgi:adenosylcobinamide-GDP ribazoletransferase